MDALLANHFRQLGGELRENTRWREAIFGPGVVRANGRRLQPRSDGCLWFGLKTHARNVALLADLEMHASRTGYVGFCRLGGGEVNVCGLFRRPADKPDSPQSWTDVLRGQTGTLLWDRLSSAVFEGDSFCSVAGLSLRPNRAASEVSAASATQ
jgi:hypothetical protein